MALFIWKKPSQLIDQHFGLDLNPEDLATAMAGCPGTSRYYVRPSRCGFHAARRQDSGSHISVEKDNFRVSLDMQQFSPEEISVRVAGNDVVVEGKHEEKQDEHGSVSRHFVRRYLLPEGYAPDGVQSHLSADGQLIITAPRSSPPQQQERVIPITTTGAPHKVVKEDTSQKTST